MDEAAQLLAEIEQRMRSAQTRDCALMWARRLVAVRFDAGYYDGALHALPDWLAEALAEMEARACS